MNKVDLQLFNEYVELDTRFCVEKHKAADLLIYGYDSRKSDNPIIWNDLNQIIRGVILDGSGQIKARSFKKFFTYR